MNKLTYKNALSCFFRFFGFSIFYSIIMALPLVLIIEYGLVFSCTQLGLNCGTYAILGMVITILTTSFLTTKFALDKVFFKPYRSFIIKAKFEKVPKGLALGLVFFTLVLSWPIALVIPESLDPDLHFLLFCFLVLCANFLVIKHVVEKCSIDLMPKNKIITEIIHD